MSITRQKISLLVCTVVVVYTFAMPLVAWGAEPSFVALEPIPGISGASAGSDIGAFVSNVFRALISLGALLAVFMLTLGAVQYMTSETLGLKEAGKERMQSAIWGLLLLISSVLILYVINPELLNFNLIVNSTKPLNVGTAASQFTQQNQNVLQGGTPSGPGAPGNGPSATTKASAEALIGNSDLTFWGAWTSSLSPAGTGEKSADPGAGSPQTRSLANTDEAAGAEVVKLLAAAERGPCFIWQGTCSAAPTVPTAAPSTLVASCSQQGVGVRLNTATNTWVCSSVK